MPEKYDYIDFNNYPFTDLYRRINDGYYDQQFIVPRPEKPLLLRKTVSELSQEEINSLPAVMEEYNKAGEKYAELSLEAKRKSGRLREEFKKDLFSHYGVDENSKFGQKMWEISITLKDTFEEQARLFVELSDLHEIYREKK